MAHLPLPTPSGAQGRTGELLRETERRWGYVPNIVRALALRPELLEAEDVWSKALMYQGLLPRTLKEAVATTVSVVNACDYCATSHAYAAERAGAAVAEACRMLRFDTLPARDRAACEYARKAARDMRSVGPKDIEALRPHFSPPEIVELTLVVGSFMLYNTFVTALGLELEPQHGASLLGPAGKPR